MVDYRNLIDMVIDFDLIQRSPKNKLEHEVAKQKRQIINTFILNNFPEEYFAFCKAFDINDFGESRNTPSDFYKFIEFLRTNC